MASKYVTSLHDLPGWRHDRSLYQAWNAGDIARTLDGKTIEENPFNPETQGLLWRTWRRGWQGIPMTPVFHGPPPLQGPVRPLKPIIVRHRLRRFKVWFRKLFR